MVVLRLLRTRSFLSISAQSCERGGRHAAEPIPRTLLREKPSPTPLSFFFSFIGLSSFAEFDCKYALPYEHERSKHSSTSLTIRNYRQVNRFAGFGVNPADDAAICFGAEDVNGWTRCRAVVGSATEKYSDLRTGQLGRNYAFPDPSVQPWRWPI